MRSNRLIKGIIAGGVGLALLIGGGTFALWSSTASVDSGSITAGTLTITADPDSTQWSDASGPIDPANFLIVPGDVVTMEADLTIDATGDNLHALLTVSPPVATGDLSSIVATSFAVTGLDPGTAENTYVVEPSASAQTVHATVTFTFPSGTTGTTGQGEILNLSETTFLLEQTTT